MNKIVMMSLLMAIMTLNLGTQAKGAIVYGFVDDPSVTGTSVTFASTVGIVIRNDSLDEVLLIDRFFIPTLPSLGGIFGNHVSVFDIETELNTGFIDSNGYLDTQFRLNPGELGFFLQRTGPLGRIEYETALGSGVGFERVQNGVAASFITHINSYGDSFAGKTSFGLDDTPTFFMEGSTELSSAPEPSSVLLSAFGAILCLAKRRR